MEIYTNIYPPLMHEVYIGYKYGHKNYILPWRKTLVKMIVFNI